MYRYLVAAMAVVLSAPPAAAGTIIVSNDDGLTSNVKALYEALKAHGHDVIVSVPCANQSGMSAAIKFFAAVKPLAADCRNGAAQAGAPGVGAMTKPGFSPDWFYVDGTPVMAMLFGIDVAGMGRWGKEPDLVLSGPNEGQNAGPLTIVSGTVGNAKVATVRGIPAVAVSAGPGSADDSALANPISAKAAELTAAFVDRLLAAAKGGPALPAGVALNLNFPDDLAAPRWKLTQVGSYSPMRIRFAMPGEPALAGFGKPLAECRGPCVSIESMRDLAASPQQQDDEGFANRRYVTLSPIKVSSQRDAVADRWLASTLKRLVPGDDRSPKR